MTAGADIFVADIGGTNARCAVAQVDRERGTTLAHQRRYRCSDFGSIDDMLLAFVADTDRALPTHAALAVAGPVTGDRITLTNNDWNFSIDQLKRRFGLLKLCVMNDLVAAAHATRHMATCDLLSIKSGHGDPDAARVVVGVGTGLGVAALTRTTNGWLAVPSEAGHASFAPDVDIESDKAVMTRRELNLRSWESVLSGPGLERRYSALTGERLSSFRIVEQAHGGDHRCANVVNDMCQTLARFARDAAIWFNATGGVFLAGGLLHDLTPWLKSADFHRAFMRDGPMSALTDSIPISLIVADQPGLIGAAVGADTHSDVAPSAPAMTLAPEMKK